LKVLRKIENIIRQEMDNYGCYEILMPGLSPKELWNKTNRWEIEEYFKLPTYDDKFYRLNPTHEELVVPLMKQFISSYKDLPTCVYQIQTKYRNEKRAKSGLLR
jgi:prolyl-tRNA synthetase